MPNVQFGTKFVLNVQFGIRFVPNVRYGTKFVPNVRFGTFCTKRTIWNKIWNKICATEAPLEGGQLTPPRILENNIKELKTELFS